MRAIKIARVVETDHGLRIVFCGLHAVQALRKDFVGFSLRENGMQKRIGEKIQSVRQILGQELSADIRKVRSGVRPERAADVIEVRRELLRRSGLCAFTEK